MFTSYKWRIRFSQPREPNDELTTSAPGHQMFKPTTEKTHFFIQLEKMHCRGHIYILVLSQELNTYIRQQNE
jgi:hypothetical protein